MAHKFLNIPEQAAVRVDPDTLQRQVVAILQAVHVPDDHAQLTAEILTAASLRGVDTHGVGNVTGYVQAIEAGRKVDLRLSTLERLAHAHSLEVWELLLPQMPEQAVAEEPAKYRKSSRSPSRKK